jgi:hypothetical protein
MVSPVLVEARLRERIPAMDDRSIRTIIESLQAMNSPAALAVLIERDALRSAEAHKEVS